MKSIQVASVGIGIAAILGISACNKTTTEPSRTSSGGATSTAPSGQDAKSADKALVRFINATPFPKDLYFGEVSAFSNVAPDAASAYSELPAQRHDFKLFTAGEDNARRLRQIAKVPARGSITL